MDEKELTEPVKLCDESGRLNPDAVGWSRKPLHTCNLQGRWPRKKKWNYWCVTNDKYAFSVTVANVDYLALGAAYFIDFETKELTEWNAATPFGLWCKMPEEVESDLWVTLPFLYIGYKHKDNIQFEGKENSPFTGIYNRSIYVNSFIRKKKILDAHFMVFDPPGHQTLNVVVPWDSNTFQFTSKQNTLPAGGNVNIDGKKFTFPYDKSFVCLDFGRGIWPFHTKWNWASCSGRNGKDIIGLNLGGMWTNGTGSTENGVCVNGKLCKISEDVKFQYNRKNFMEPWKIFTPDSDIVNLTFSPFFEKKNKMNLLLLSTEVHQMFGKFSGTVKTPDNDVNFHDFIGWAEESISRW